MKQQFLDELDPEVKIRMKKNVVYIAIFAVVMAFAGLTSAYFVSMGDTFWLKYPMPSGFWISTAFIALSSLTYIIALRYSAAGNRKMLKVFMVITFIFALLFVRFQFYGYGQLVDKGAQLRNEILVTNGRYGDYFEIKYLDKFIEVNANEYQIDGRELTEAQYAELRSFIKPFLKAPKLSGDHYPALKPKFTLYFHGEPVLVQQGKLVTTSGKAVEYLDRERLYYLALNIRDGRGDFFFKGKLGKDFNIHYKGKQLSYKNRELYFGPKKLDGPLQLKINQSMDTASAYLYIITFLHLLHVGGALIYLFRMVLISFKSNLSTDNQLSIRLGAIFWHFLGILWIYLLVFLLFIH